MALPPKPKIRPVIRRSLLATSLGAAALTGAACGEVTTPDADIVAPMVPPSDAIPPQVPPDATTGGDGATGGLDAIAPQPPPDADLARSDSPARSSDGPDGPDDPDGPDGELP